MWCPPDYIHIHEVYEQCQSVAGRLVPYEQGKELVYLDKDQGEFDYCNSNEYRRRVVEGKLLELFTNKHRSKAFACSMPDKVVRLSPYIVRPVIFNHFTDFERTFARHAELLYVSLSSGKIDISGTAQRIASWSSFPGDAACADVWQRDAAADFGELDGWCICYSREEVSASADAIEELWKRREPAGEYRAVGRPRERESVGDAYRRLFPQGHGNRTWKQVLRELEAAGTATSETTLKRALAQNG